MKNYFCDLHIHIGATSRGKPVKITASRSLIFEKIINESLSKKGMDLIGVVDCASPGVLRDIRRMIDLGELCQMKEGGLLHRDRLAVLPGSEVETTEDGGGCSHHISFFPDIKTITEFSRVMSRYITNIELSSQKAGMSAAQLFDVTKATGGIMIPAHVFTPHKSLYGNVGPRLEEIINRGRDAVYAVELGLSADTHIADHLSELENITFLSNSDAHSIPKIAREYNIIEMERPNFREFVLALLRRGGRRVVANVGLDPKLGRYHRTYCLKCRQVQHGLPPVLECGLCGAAGKDIVKGVYDRIKEIADYESPVHPSHRPPYKYQIPLNFVPGINKKILDHILKIFGTEMAVLNAASDKEIKDALPLEIAKDLICARNGVSRLSAGGGGSHGKVMEREAAYYQLSLDFS